MTLTGIDVSATGQGLDFDWAAWHGKIQFAYAKATEGTSFRDPAFAVNWAAMRSLGIVRGAYHFLHASIDGKAQAAYFLADARPGPGDLLAVDVEQAGLDGLSPADLWAQADAFSLAVRAATGCWPWAYTDISLTTSAPSELGGQPLWLADPSAVPTPAPVGPWNLVTAEQTGQRGVDTDVFYGDLADLARLAVPAPKPDVMGYATFRAAATAAGAALAQMVVYGSQHQG